MQREEPYLGLTYTGNHVLGIRGSVNRWCMAVVSSFRDMLG